MIITPSTRFPFRIFLKSTRPPWSSILVKLISTPFQFNRANYSKWVWELYLAGSTFISIGIFGQNMMPLCPSMHHSSKYTLLLNPINTHLPCRTIPINWKMTLGWIQLSGPRRCVIMQSHPSGCFHLVNLSNLWKIVLSFSFQVRDGCHTWSSLESWSRGLWSRLLHARAPHKSRLANIGGFYISSQLSSRSHLVHHVNDVTVDIVHQRVRNKLLRKICEREMFLSHVEGVTPKYFWLQYLYSIN